MPAPAVNRPFVAGSRLRLGVWIALVLSVSVACYAALHKQPWPEEGWFASPSLNLAENGFMGTTLLDPNGHGLELTRIDQRTYWVLPGFLVAKALWYELAPATLFGARLFSVLWMPVLAGALFVYVRKLFPDDASPHIAAILILCNYIAIDMAAFSRPEILCAALGVGALAAYVWWREAHLTRALIVANLLVACSGLTHPNGVWHAAALAILVLWFDASRLSWTAIVCAGLPYLILGSAWSLYIFQDPQAFRDQMAANTYDRWSSSLNPLAILSSELDRYWEAYGFVTGGIARLKVVALLFLWAGALGCLSVRDLRRRPSVRLLLLQLAVYFVGMCIFNQKLTFYLVHIVPMYLALTAVWLVWLGGRGDVWVRAIAAAVVVLIGLELGGISLRSRRRSYVESHRQVLAYIERRSTADSLITAHGGFAFAAGFDPRLQDDAYLGLDTGREPDFIVVEEFYRHLYEGWSKGRPGDLARIEARLGEYETVFEVNGYQVYERAKPPDEAQTGEIPDQ